QFLQQVEYQRIETGQGRLSQYLLKGQHEAPAGRQQQQGEQGQGAGLGMVGVQQASREGMQTRMAPAPVQGARHPVAGVGLQQAQQPPYQPQTEPEHDDQQGEQQGQAAGHFSGQAQGGTEY